MLSAPIHQSHGQSEFKSLLILGRSDPMSPSLAYMPLYKALQVERETTGPLLGGLRL